MGGGVIWVQIVAPTRTGKQGVFSSGWWQSGKKVPDSLMGPLHRAPLEFQGHSRGIKQYAWRSVPGLQERGQSELPSRSGWVLRTPLRLPPRLRLRIVPCNARVPSGRAPRPTLVEIESGSSFPFLAASPPIPRSRNSYPTVRLMSSSRWYFTVDRRTRGWGAAGRLSLESRWRFGRSAARSHHGGRCSSPGPPRVAVRSGRLPVQIRIRPARASTAGPGPG